jgi:radical SAM superfamily enzyme YgiQ (UPF0313 family)
MSGFSTRDIPHILLINPWIHDFAAYDFWAKPIGLLYLAAILRLHGFSISYIDCLDRFHPESERGRKKASYGEKLGPMEKKDGRGPYLKTLIPKPKGLENVPRNFSRYGIKPEWFVRDLSAIHRPDLILVTSLMTYWYSGVKETIETVKTIFPDVPVICGGIYATLCHDHAVSNLNADHVVSGAGEQIILKIVSDFTGYSVSPLFDAKDLSSYPYPAFDLQRKIPYVPLMTSRGCPYSCAYCASNFLHPNRMIRQPEQVLDEIGFWHEKYGVKNFAFYDDALLVDCENHALKLFEAIIRKDLRVRFHTPNALHIREIDQHTAELMYRAGFDTIRLGLETAVFEKRNRLDRKVTESLFHRAVACLFKAGFKKEQIGAYLLVGLPGQNPDSIVDSIEVVKRSGITPVMAHYTPIPHTSLWEKAVQSSKYDLESDPVFTNNAISPCTQEEFSWQTLSYLKNLAVD